MWNIWLWPKVKIRRNGWDGKYFFSLHHIHTVCHTRPSWRLSCHWFYFSLTFEFCRKHTAMTHTPVLNLFFSLTSYKSICDAKLRVAGAGQTPHIYLCNACQGFACCLVEVCVAAPSAGSPNAHSALQAKAVVHHVQRGIICIRFCWLKYLLDQTHTGGLCGGPARSAPTHRCCCLCFVSYHHFPLCSAILY